MKTGQRVLIDRRLRSVEPVCGGYMKSARSWSMSLGDKLLAALAASIAGRADIMQGLRKHPLLRLCRNR